MKQFLIIWLSSFLLKVREAWHRFVVWFEGVRYRTVVLAERIQLRSRQWLYWQEHFSHLPVPAKAKEQPITQLTCPDCNCSYDLARLGIRSANKQATVQCHCGNVLELKPHQHMGWLAPAVVVRGHTHSGERVQ